MAADVVEAGFTQMKFDVECIASDLTRDIWNRSLTTQQLRCIAERLGIVRRTAGWDVDLCIDCHMNYNVPDAIRLAPRTGRPEAALA